MKKEMIIWLLYITLFVYNMLDVYQTKILFDYGAIEMNPILVCIISNPTDIYTIILLKLFFLISLGILIYINNRGKKNDFTRIS